MDKIKIEYLPVDELTPYKKNARKHAKDDVGAIVKSIEEFGFSDPIGIWSDKNIIVEGHGRLLAAKKLHMDTVPCIRLDYMTDEQRRAYALAHNKTAELSEWDFDLLDEELDSILDIDMSDFGFDLNFDDDEIKERKEANFDDNVSIVVECENDEEAEKIFNELTELGYTCKISTLREKIKLKMYLLECQKYKRISM